MQNQIKSQIVSVVDSVRPGYASSYSDVIDAVATSLAETLEKGITSLHNEATSRGITSAQFYTAVENAGLYVPEPEPVEEDSEEESDLATQVRSLTSTVQTLVDLANRHLGARI